MEELKRIIDDSEITKEDDALWPPPDRVGRQVCQIFKKIRSRCIAILPRYLAKFNAWRIPGELNAILLKTEIKNLLSSPNQELEIVIGDEHISFTTSKIGSLIDVNQSK